MYHLLASPVGSGEEIHQLAECFPDMVLVHAEGEVVFANPAAARLLGAAGPDDLVGRCVLDFADGALRDRIRRRITAMLDQGRPAPRAEHRYRRLDGSGHVDVEVVSVPFSWRGSPAILSVGRDITQRRAAENRLRARERQLAEAQHVARVGSWEWELDGGTLDASEEMFTLFGVERPRGRRPAAADFLGRVHPADVKDVRAALRRALRHGEGFELELRVPRGDGGLTFIRARADVEDDVRGAPVRLIGTAQDVTRDRDARHRLEESEQRYRSLFQYNPAAVFSLDREGRFTSANPACTITGYAPDELLGQTFHPLVVAEHLPRAVDNFHAALAGASQSLELGVSHRDGHRLELCITTTPIVVAGEVVGVFGIAEDVTDRRAAQAALARSEELLRTVIDASPVGILMLDPQGKVLAWSSGAERIFGWTADEVRHRPPPFVPGDEEAFRARLHRVLAGEPLMGLELVRRRKDGVAVPMSLSAAPLRESDGSVTGVVAVIVDDTPRRAVELALHESRQQLLHAQKMEAVGRLAGGIAHDFNNLLTAIKGGAQMLLLDTPEDAPARADLLEIDESVERATALTRQLLTFSRKGVADPRVMDLNALLPRTERLLARVLGKDVAVDTRVGPGPACIVADPGEVEQVLLNLAVNARDAMPRGGTITLETSTVELRGPFGPEHPELGPGRYVVLCVTDTGEGMTPDVRERAFDPFFTTKPQGQGTGLGLSTVYGIVRQSGGFIQLHSEPGHGTSFRIFFPEAAGECGEEAEPAEPMHTEARTETLLLVEDDPAVRGVVERVLARAGYRMLLAATGAQALELCARAPGCVDLLITDVVMPGMGGAELASRMRAQRPGLEVLYMSGYADEVVSNHGVLNPGVDFIQKPFSPQELAQRVREVLDRARRG